ncbi:probable G-protein coupled receptor 139 [Protopterus annectens]|uniref:probable G-protein coupled receptor 139 n=1 Tax=Protopterus annectens TaxID=7888 RepID=UPI001CFA2E49|nr:probable G-protein coupled receptor 139 [Protopterus annectens]
MCLTGIPSRMPRSKGLFVVIQQIYYPALCVFGLPANLFTAYMIQFQKCGMSKTAGIYLTSLAIMDFFCLLWGALIDLSLYWLQGYTFWNREPWCGLLTVMEYGAMFSSIWIIVAFTIERYLVLRSTHARQQHSESAITVKIVFGVIVTSHLIGVPSFWINEVLVGNFTSGNETKALPQCTYKDDAYATVVVWLHTFIQGGIPFSLIMVFNFLLGYELHKAGKMFTKEQKKAMNVIGRKGVVTRTMLLLLTVSFTFVALCLPRFVTYCILRTIYNTPNHDRNDYKQLINVFADIGIMLQYLNSAINFLLYCVVSKQFRFAFWTLLSCKGRIKQRKSLASQLTSNIFAVIEKKSEQTKETSLHETST